MNEYKNFQDIGTQEPRGWNVDKKEFTIYDENQSDPEDNEIPNPYQDDFEEDVNQETDYEEIEDEYMTSGDESDASSLKSEKSLPKKKKFKVILQEEEFLDE